MTTKPIKLNNKYHQELVDELAKSAKTKTSSFNNDSYLGSKDFKYAISVPECRRIAKEFLKKHKELSWEDFVNLLDCLNKGYSHEEKTMGGKLLEYMPEFRKLVTPDKLDEWLNNLEGWNQVDCLCQSVFKANQVLENWDEWKGYLEKFSKSDKVSKRRASLVLLTGPVAEVPDMRLSKLAFEIMDKLKQEKDILITKAISWLLRNMVVNHRKEVEEYLNRNVNILPNFVVREVRNKLVTGRKS